MIKTITGGFLPRVALSFSKKVDTAFVAFVRNILTLLGLLKVQYPSPQPPLDVITTSVNAFETKVHEALNGGRIEIGARNAARYELDSLMRQLAYYVTANCGNDVQNIIETGFEPVRAASAVGSLLPPQNARLEYKGRSGELLLKFDRVGNARNYSIQTAESAEGPWEDEDLSTKAQVTIGGLTPGKVYWARACANGASGASDWSGPATAMAV